MRAALQLKRLAAAVVAVALTSACNPNRAVDKSMVSDLKADETLVFFATAAWFDASTAQWQLPIHGWVFEPADSKVRLAAFKTVLKRKFDLAVDDQSKPIFARRTNALLADNERGKTIVIALGQQRYRLPASAKNGHFESVITLPETAALALEKVGSIAFSAVLPDDDDRRFEGSVRLLPRTGISVISDIDDTVKISHVTDRGRLLEQTFLREFVAVPGMAQRYRAWAEHGAAFHFVSSSPWQLYTDLDAFMTAQGFPPATFSLKVVRFRDETLLDLFKKGTATKPKAIAAILERYPERRFVLIGDSGEQDPEVYADFLRERPQQVTKAYIRNVTAEARDSRRFTKAFANIAADRWHVFDDPAELTLP